MTAQQAFGKTLRDYASDERPAVREFYRVHHRRQTLSFVLEKKREFLGLNRRRLGVWEALLWLDTLVDDSDPDTGLSQLEHAMQAAEAARKERQPEWLVLTALLHDLGKVLCLFGEPQWAVVGDTHPVGCAFSDRIVHFEFLQENPDLQSPRLSSLMGIYEPGCGLDRVHLTWGHDEYLYQVLKDHLPQEALAAIRYHSFYSWHTEGAYGHLMAAENAFDLESVRRFNRYDLYSKVDERPDVTALTPFYRDLIHAYIPGEVRW